MLLLKKSRNAMENKIIALSIIFLLIGLLIGYAVGVSMTLNIIADKALALGNFSDIVKAKIKERCLGSLNTCFGEK